MRLLLNHKNELTLSITKREHNKLQVGLNTLHSGLIKVLFQDMLTVYINHQREMAVIDFQNRLDESRRNNDDDRNWHE